MSRLHVLFVCGRNQKRSPTAQKLFQNDPRLSVRSAGTSDSSRRTISQDDLGWAAVILVMERKYESSIRAKFPDYAPMPPMHSLEIPDDYEFMDDDLVELLLASVESALDPYLTGRHD